MNGKKLIIMAVAAVLLLSCRRQQIRLTPFGNIEWELGEKAPEGMVYVCDGPHARAYHLFENCSGLVNCSGDVTLISQEEAEKMGRHLCHYCKASKDDY